MIEIALLLVVLALVGALAFAFSTQRKLGAVKETLGRSLAEVAAYKREADEARPYVEQAGELKAELASAQSTLAERERAYQETLQGRERSYNDTLAERARFYEKTLAEREKAHLETLSEKEKAFADALQARDEFHAKSLAEREHSHKMAAEERDRMHNRQLEEMNQRFQAIAAETLEKAQLQFLNQSEETLKRHREEAAKGLAENRTALSDMVAPMRDTLNRYGEELKALEAKREQAYGSLSEQLQSVAAGQMAVQQEAGKIVSALRSSARASGVWGEAQLRNTLEMGGLREGIDFDLQASTTDEEGQRRRPDAVLKLPGGRTLVVDSKCSVADYIEASGCQNDTDRLNFMRRHAQSVRNHAKGLSEKAYWKEFAESADFVVMFIPGENFLSAALEHDLDLLAWAQDQRILLAGPTNLLAIARVVSMVWRQEKMAEEARTIGKLGSELYQGLATMTEYLNKVGKNINDAANAYNSLVGSLERNVLPKARRFSKLGVETGKKPIADPLLVETTLRQVQAPELLQLEKQE